MSQAENLCLQNFFNYGFTLKEQEEFLKIAKPIISHPEFEKRCLEPFFHHGSTTLGDHIIKDALITYRLAKIYKYKHPHREIDEALAVVIALFHDLYTSPWQNTDLEKPLFEKHGFIHQGFRNGSDNNYEPRWMSILPLEGKDEEDILKKCDSKTRQNIVNTQKTGLKIDRLNKSELYRLHDMVSTTGQRRHFLNPDLSYYTDFMTSFHENMQAYCVYLDTKDYYERYRKNYEDPAPGAECKIYPFQSCRIQSAGVCMQISRGNRDCGIYDKSDHR